MSTKMARHLTSEAFHEALRQMAEEDAAKAAQKQVNEAERGLSERRKEWRAEEQAARKAALDAWEEKKEAAVR